MKEQDTEFSLPVNPVHNHAAYKVDAGQKKYQFKPCRVINMCTGSFRAKIIFDECCYTDGYCQNYEDKSGQPEREEYVQKSPQD